MMERSISFKAYSARITQEMYHLWGCRHFALKIQASNKYSWNTSLFYSMLRKHLAGSIHLWWCKCFQMTLQRHFIAVVISIIFTENWVRKRLESTAVHCALAMHETELIKNISFPSFLSPCLTTPSRLHTHSKNKNSEDRGSWVTGCDSRERWL